ncbi:MAG: penicillin-binding protein 2 [Chloroflexia bacterium]|nr:penicillin-binding protein 2 [Chloroflexia bacterium]
MSRYGNAYGSPYAQPRIARPRWPWAVATILLLAIFATSGLLVFDRLDRDQSPLGQLAQRVTPEGTDTAAIAATEQPSPTPEPTIEPTQAPTATAVDTQAPVRTAENWLALWSTGDYSAMYDLASKEVQASTSRDAFATRYSQIADEAGLIAISGEIVGEPGLDGQVMVDVTLESNLVGVITERNVIPLVKEDDAWRVAWTPSLIFRQIGSTGCIDFQGEIPRRGSIFDRNGEVLAEDASVARIGVIPGDVPDHQAMAAALSPIVSIPAADIVNMANRDGWDPTWLVPIAEIPGEPDARLINRVQQIPGVVVQPAVSRFYPQGALTAHITGWVSTATVEDVQNDDTGSVHQNEMIGRSGLEFGANELLAGTPGGSLNVIDCESRGVTEEIASSEGTPPQNLHLTIDLEMQRQVDAALTAQESEDGQDGMRSAAVYIDPRDGAVLAMVSHPSFDPNDAVNNTYTEDERELLNDELLRPQANRATREQYPTGSIFKVITAAAAMHYLDYTAETPIDCPERFTIGNQSWDDWVVENGLSAQGPLTLHSGLVRSCNTVFYQLGAALDQHDPNALPDMTKAFGLGETTQIPYFPEVAGTVPDPQWKLSVVGDGWSTGDAVNLSIGQGYLIATPLQMANAYAAVANGGTLLRPYIVDRVQDPDGTFTQVGQREVIRELPLTNAQVDDLQAALAEQTHNPDNVGSARIFNDFDWPISGKTGTAQNELDGSDKPHAWFAAYGGSDGEATIASVVLIENIGEGVAYAAPSTRQVYEWYIASDLNDDDETTATRE